MKLFGAGRVTKCFTRCMPPSPDPLNRIRWPWPREGDRVVVVSGEHTGRFGRVALTHDSKHHQLVARLLALSPERCRVMLDRHEDMGGWSGVLSIGDLRPIFGAYCPNGGFTRR